MINIEQDFMLVNLSQKHRGLLKTVGGREIVVDMRVIDTADEADNTWLMEQIMSLYKTYYNRVTGGAL